MPLVAEGRPRSLVLVCLALLAAAAALQGASALTWYRVTAQVPLRGAVPVAFDGAQVRPSLTGVALLALAGVAAAVALSGALRRLLGLLLAAAGVFVAATALVAFDGALPAAPADVPAGALPARADAVTAAPALAVAGGLLLLAVGGLVLVRERALPRFGARYAAPAARRAPADPDRAAWQDLDAGRDPTV